MYIMVMIICIHKKTAQTNAKNKQQNHNVYIYIYMYIYILMATCRINPFSLMNYSPQAGNFSAILTRCLVTDEVLLRSQAVLVLFLPTWL